MSDALVFYTNPQSRGRIVRWMLEELGRPYETVVLDYGTTMKGADYLALNPMGKVPAIRHGETVVTECGAICAYLADAFPDAGLAPPLGDARRGPYFRWMFYAAGPLEAAWTNRAMGFEVPPERRRMMGYGCWDDVMTTLSFALEGREFVAGDRFTAADVYLAASLGFGIQFGFIKDQPVLEAYAARLRARPAAVRAHEIDEALVAAAKG
jgi:glutathione S-transferase